MNKKQILGIITLAIAVIAIVVIGTRKEKYVTFTDVDGNEIGYVVIEDQKIKIECDDSVWSYIDIATREALDVLGYSVDDSKAIKEFVESEVKIETYMDKEIVDAIHEGYEANQNNVRNAEFASVITDVNGCVKGCFSMSDQTVSTNNVVRKTYAGSTIKPISVYGPLIEMKSADMDTLYYDKPYSYILDENNKKVPWPKNTGRYTGEEITLEEAVKKSNNAVAVRALKDLGVDISLDYLENSFGLDVSSERELYKEKGEDEILGKVALGYLDSGVSVYKMTECYQPFANGGEIYPLHCIESIKSEEGEDIYHQNLTSKRVFSEDTAYKMNRILKSVVSEDGTADKACIEGDDICGKTGTTENNKDNWFIGFTSEYICSVWYGQSNVPINSNEADVIFKDIVSGIRIDAN